MKTKWNWIVILAMLFGLVFTGPRQTAKAATANLTIEPSALPDAMITVNFQLVLIARYAGGGECANCTWYTTSGDLPEGVHINGDTGELLGAPAAVGTYTFTVVADDHSGTPGSQAYTWTITKVRPIVDVGLNSTTYVGNTAPISLGAAARHPNPYYTPAPTGKISFSVDGVPVPGCSGTEAKSTNNEGAAYCTSYIPPTGLTAGAYDIQAEFTPDSVSSALYQSAAGTGTLQVNPPQAIVTGLVFMDDDQDGYRDETEVAHGSWNVFLNQDCDSFLEGNVVTDSLTGEFTYYPVPIDGHTYCLYVDLAGFDGYVQTTHYDNLKLSGDQYFEIGVYYPHIDILPNPEETLRGSIGAYFEQAFEVYAGAPPYTMQPSSVLPDGLTFDPDTFTLSGTPTAGGTSELVLHVTDSNGLTADIKYRLSIQAVGVFDLTSSANPSTPGDEVTFTFSGSGAVVDLQFGAVPPVGLVTFSADGTPIDGCSGLILNVLIDENGEPVFDENGNPTFGNYPVICTMAALEMSMHEITAAYIDGMGLYSDDTLTLTQVVALPKITPELLISISDPSYYGRLFNVGTFARANNQDIRGLVDFAIDGVPVAACQDVTLNTDDQYFCQGVDLTLAVGSHTLTAEFTPTDADTYNPASGSIPFAVEAGSYLIQGAVFQDQNQDGTYTSGEYWASGWTINLTTCAGNSVIGTDENVIVPQVSSNYWGSFTFKNVPGGQCIRLSEEAQPGWQPTTPTQVDLTLSQDVYPVYFGNYYPRIIVSTEIDPLPVGSVGAAYGPVAFTATGGTGTYTYTLKDGYGVLPAGLQLSAEGALSGTPTLAGAYFFAVQAEDQNQAAGYQYYSITVMTDATFDLSSSSNPSSPGEAVTFTFSASGEALDPYYGGTQPPHGQVTFQADGVDIEGCIGMDLNYDLANYAYGDFPAACTTSALGAGTHEIQALYTDETECFQDATLTLTQVVEAQTVSADLAITTMDKPDPVKPGAKLVYALTVTNLGPNTAESVIVTDKIDVKTTYVSVSAPEGWTCKFKKGTLTCTTSGLDSGATATINLTVKVSKTAKVGKDLVNNAFVSSLTDDLDLTDNSVVEKTLVMK